MCSARRVVEEYYVRRVRDGQRDADELQQRLPEAHRSSAAKSIRGLSQQPKRFSRATKPVPAASLARARFIARHVGYCMLNRDRRPLLLP